MLVSSAFIFPDDLMLLSFIFHSLRVEFIDGTHSRHFFDAPMGFLKAEMPDEVVDRIIALLQPLLELSSSAYRENNMPMMKTCVRGVSDALDFLTFCSTFLNLNVSFGDDFLPLFDTIQDVGVACRFLVFGFHLGISKTALSEIADRSFDSHFVSDLGEDSLIIPFGLREFEDVVQPYRPGSNWRLIIYIVLQFPEFPDFSARFMKIVEQIREQRIEVQIALVLIELLIERMSEFAADFNGCVNLVTEVVKLVLDRDTTVLRPLLRLLKTMNHVKAIISYEGDELRLMFDEMNRAFRRFGNMQSKQLQRLFASIKGELAELVFGSQKMEEGPEPEEPTQQETKLFRIADSSDGAFRPESERHSEEEDIA
jgi:hypothetical protein